MQDDHLVGYWIFQARENGKLGLDGGDKKTRGLNRLEKQVEEIGMTRW